MARPTDPEIPEVFDPCSWAEVLGEITHECHGDLASLDERDDESPFYRLREGA